MDLGDVDESRELLTSKDRVAELPVMVLPLVTDVSLSVGKTKNDES